MVVAPETHGRTEAKDAAAIKLQSRQRDKLRGMNRHLVNLGDYLDIFGGTDIQLLFFLMFTMALPGTMALIHSHTATTFRYMEGGRDRDALEVV